MKLNYTLLLTDISKKQGLGIPASEMPLIIHTDLFTYTMAQITYEDEDHIIIIVPSQKGEEFAKIVNKDTINTIEIIYQQMLETPKNSKGDVMYG